MRILVISNYYPPLEIGGWEQNTRDVAEELSKRGHTVEVLTSRYRRDEITGEEFPKRELYLDSPDHVHYHLSYLFRHRYNEARNTKLIADTVRTFNPEVIFITGMWNMPVSVAQCAETLMPHRVIYHIASYWAISADAHSAFWKVGSLPKRWVGKLMTRTLAAPIDRAALNFEHVLCVSEYMRTRLIKSGVIKPENSRVVHNGIDPTEYIPAHDSSSGDTLRLLYAGRLSPDKGVHTAIEALAKLPPALPVPVTLSIVGSGAPEYINRLETLRHSLGVSNSVKLWGQVPREKMPDILAQHDVLLLLSIWEEPLARMTQEAMASGLTVIGTPTGGTPEILFDGENGLWVEPDNPDQLVKRITFLLENPALRLKFAVSARDIVLKKFTFSRMVNEIEENLTEVMENAIASQSIGINEWLNC